MIRPLTGHQVKHAQTRADKIGALPCRQQGSRFVRVQTVGYQRIVQLRLHALQIVRRVLTVFKATADPAQDALVATADVLGLHRTISDASIGTYAKQPDRGQWRFLVLRKNLIEVSKDA